MKTGLIFIVLTLAAACSHKAVYDTIQHNNRLDCEKEPPAQYDQCMEETHQSYEEYERQRKDSTDK